MDRTCNTIWNHRGRTFDKEEIPKGRSDSRAAGSWPSCLPLASLSVYMSIYLPINAEIINEGTLLDLVLH